MNAADLQQNAQSRFWIEGKEEPKTEREKKIDFIYMYSEFLSSGDSCTAQWYVKLEMIFNFWHANLTALNTHYTHIDSDVLVKP